MPPPGTTQIAATGGSCSTDHVVATGRLGGQPDLKLRKCRYCDKRPVSLFAFQPAPTPPLLTQATNPASATAVTAWTRFVLTWPIVTQRSSAQSTPVRNALDTSPGRQSLWTINDCTKASAIAFRGGKAGFAACATVCQYLLALFSQHLSFGQRERE